MLHVPGSIPGGVATNKKPAEVAGCVSFPVIPGVNAFLNCPSGDGYCHRAIIVTVAPVAHRDANYNVAFPGPVFHFIKTELAAVTERAWLVIHNLPLRRQFGGFVSVYQFCPRLALVAVDWH